jgi:hypothetical protein
LNVTGKSTLTTPGQMTQLSAQVTLPDGSKMDVTSTSTWSSQDQRVATVSPAGLVTAVDFGKTTINVETSLSLSSGAQVVRAPFSITVLADGTYILSGRVDEGGYFPVKDARVEIIGGPMNGRIEIASSNGEFSFTGVAGVFQVRASKEGYVPATKDVSVTASNLERIELMLTYDAPPSLIGSVYRLTFIASPSCQLPDDARRRTYTATINPGGVGNRAIVTLTGAEFWTDSYCGLMNSFDALVHGNSLVVSDYGGDCGVVERLADKRYLYWAGTAEATLSDTTSTAAFNASVAVRTSPNSGSDLIADCDAPDHQLVFERIASSLR